MWSSFTQQTKVAEEDIAIDLSSKASSSFPCFSPPSPSPPLSPTASSCSDSSFSSLSSSISPSNTNVKSFTKDSLLFNDGRSRLKSQKKGVHKCLECGKHFATSSNLSRHKQTHRKL